MSLNETTNVGKAPVLGFGPWAAGIDHAERLARLRSMRALALVLVRCSPDFIAALRAAETDEEALDRAADLLNRLPTLFRRRMLATYQILDSRP
jgi:hypothetical protein